MKKILTSMVALFMLMIVFQSANAADFYGSISATSFDAEEGWVAAPGFDYGWNAAAPEANIYSNERNTVTLLLDGYTDCIGDVQVIIGRLSFAAWDWKESHYYYSSEEGSENAVLTAADFTDGMATLELKLPAGMKPWNTYEDLEADEFRAWTVQVIGSNSSVDHECGETYMNFVIDVTEEIVESTTQEEFAGLYGSISATSFDAEEGWVAAPGFDYGWNAAAPEANIYSNERNTVNLLIDGYAECVGDVTVKIGRLSFTAWTFLDDYFYYSAEDVTENPVLTAADFTNGRATLALKLPEGIKPWNTYGDLEADEFRAWTVQVIGSNSSADAECGETYMNFVIDVTEEITTGTGFENLNFAEMNVYPNPVKSGDQLYINASEFSNDITINVYSLSGQCVSTQHSTASSQISVNANFKAGIYSMEITDGIKRSVKKIAVN